MRQRMLGIGLFFLGILLLTNSSNAQLISIGSDSGISGKGNASVQVAPSRLRMQLQISASGSTADLALERLKARRDAAKTKLESLGTDMSSIALSNTTVTATSTVSNSPLPSTYGAPALPATFSPYTVPTPEPASTPVSPVMAPVATPTPVSPTPTAPVEREAKKPIPQFYTASATLRADWVIDKKSIDEILRDTEALRGNVAAADLAGMKDTKNLSAEEQELIEEHQSPAVPALPPLAPQQPSPFPTIVSPVSAQSQSVAEFAYVGVLSDAQRKAALAQAFGKAKQQAVELTEAAGCSLGELVSLRSDMGNNESPMMIFGAPATAPRENEVVRGIPDALTFIVNVSVTYHIQPR